MSQPEHSASQEPFAPSPQNPYHAPQAALDSGVRSFVTRSDERLNPWTSIWARPRATIRQIIDTDPTYMVVPLAALAGIVQGLDNASSRSMGDKLPLGAILGMALVFGPFGGMISLYLAGAMLRWTGSWLGGVANSVQVRAAVAWGQLPGICTIPIWIAQLILFQEEMFTTDTPRLDANQSLAFVMLGFAIVEMVLGIWSLVTIIKCLAEVHQFSAWGRLGAAALAFLVVMAILMPFIILAIGLSAAGR